MKRKIIEIDESKCNGCGLCIPGCKEGALQIVDGKAKLVADAYCDGLGACLGECPQGALKIVERTADPYDEVLTNEHLKRLGRPTVGHQDQLGPAHHHAIDQKHSYEHGGRCPGSAQRILNRASPCSASTTTSNNSSELRHWPVQLQLVPAQAPFLKGADIVLCADCVPFAFPDLHAQYLRNRAVLVGCPKLDDLDQYEEKLRVIFQQAKPKSVTVLRMEVPCCGGLVGAAQNAYAQAQATFPLSAHIFGIEGAIIRKDHLT